MFSDEKSSSFDDRARDFFRFERSTSLALSAKGRLVLCLLALFISLIGLLIGGISLVKSFHQPSWVSCGSTTTEARANNCHFDPMLRAWVPHACFFHEPLDEYDVFHDRLWYMDANLTEPADPAVLQAGEGDYLVYSKEYHKEHCLYTWRKLAIAVEKKYRFVDSKSYDLAHSTHCAKSITTIIRDRYEKAMAGEVEVIQGYSWVSLGFYECVPLPWSDGAKVGLE